GSRVQTVMAELGGEKIDIIEWSEDPVKFIANGLSPAKILNVQLDEGAKEAKVGVLEDQLSLAIGKAGQNVRLAARLTGWKIDIRSESQVAKAALIAATSGGEETEETGAPVEQPVEAPVAVTAQRVPAVVGEETTEENLP